MVCTKCNVDKPIDQYGTYYHSTQQKTRIRKYCKTCYSEQQKVTKQKIRMKQDFDKTKFKICVDCNELKPIDKFYPQKKYGKVYRNSRCNICQNRFNKKRENLKKIEEGIGCSKVPRNPNEYCDNIQKTDTFTFMKRLGYLYNEKLGIWFKDGVKELRDGQIVFLKLKPKKRKRDGKLKKKTNQNWIP